MGPGWVLLVLWKRHQAWQVRGSWEEQHVQLGGPGAAILWFRPLHHHLVQMPKKSCTCVKVSTHTTQPFVGHNLRLPLIAPNGIHKWQNCTEPNDLSGTLRGTVAEGSANEPRAPLLHCRGRPRHWLFIKSKEKNTPKTASFLWSLSLQSKQKQSYS